MTVTVNQRENFILDLELCRGLFRHSPLKIIKECLKIVYYLKYGVK